MTALPAEHVALIDACRDRAESDLIPATADQIDQAIVALGGLQLSPKQGVTAAALENAYHIGLDDVPADLLAAAVRLALKHKTFRPMPAEVRVFIEDELAARKRRHARLGRPL